MPFTLRKAQSPGAMSIVVLTTSLHGVTGSEIAETGATAAALLASRETAFRDEPVDACDACNDIIDRGTRLARERARNPAARPPLP